jgi:hypothetical protein
MTNRSRAAWGGFWVLFALASSCAESTDIDVVKVDGGDPPDSTVDGVADGDMDGGDAGADSTSDAPVDATEDALADGGDGSSDAPIDAPPDVTPDAMPATGLGLFFKFEDTTGPEFDYAGNNNNGTVSGPVARGVPGKVGLSFDFSATGMVVAKSSPSLDMLTGGTIEVWVKLSSVATGSIVSRGTGLNDNSVRIRTAQGNVAVYFTRAGGGSAILTSNPNLLQTGQWTHIAATNDGATLKLYIDGNLNTTATGGQLGSQFADLHVGKSAGTDNAFNGSVDELRWWTVVRTDAEICQDAGGTTATVDGSSVCTIP